MKYKIKEINVDAGEFTVILNTADAKDMGVRSLDRVKVITGEHTLTSIVETSDTVVAQGEIGILCKAFEKLQACDGGDVEVIPTGRPHSVELIKKKIEGHVLTSDEIREIGPNPIRL